MGVIQGHFGAERPKKPVIEKLSANGVVKETVNGYIFYPYVIENYLESIGIKHEDKIVASLMTDWVNMEDEELAQAAMRSNKMDWGKEKLRPLYWALALELRERTREQS